MLGRVPCARSSRSRAAVLDTSSSLLPLASRLSQPLTYTSSRFLPNLSAATWIFFPSNLAPFQSAFPEAARVIFSKVYLKKPHISWLSYYGGHLLGMAWLPPTSPAASAAMLLLAWCDFLLQGLLLVLWEPLSHSLPSEYVPVLQSSA